MKRIEEFKRCDCFIEQLEQVLYKPIKRKNEVYYTGVDLGTACIVMAVLDENREPVACAFRYADVVKDGMLLDYIGAIRILKEMKAEIERNIDCELLYAAGAIPPGTDNLDGGAVKNVIEAAGFVVTAMTDEPIAANNILGVNNGAIVDIGGGTTGISIIENGKIVKVTDEPTGGIHFTLVLAGAYKMDFEKADKYKRNPENHKEIMPILIPVADKVSSIIKKAVTGYNVNNIVLVGGSSCLTGLEDVIEKNLGIKTHKPLNPLFVTPAGIALSCTQCEME